MKIYRKAAVTTLPQLSESEIKEWQQLKRLIGKSTVLRKYFTKTANPNFAKAATEIFIDLSRMINAGLTFTDIKRAIQLLNKGADYKEEQQEKHMTPMVQPEATPKTLWQGRSLPTLPPELK